MNENENLRQSSTVATLIKLSDDEWVVAIGNAIIGNITVNIRAEFPNRLRAEEFILSFGIEGWTHRNLID